MPKKPALSGPASVKAKKIKKLKNFKQKNETSAIDENELSNLNCDMVETKILTTVVNSLSDDEPIFGFSPQPQNKFDKKTVKNDVTVHIVSDEEDFLGFTPEKDQTCESKLVGMESSFISRNDATMKPIESLGLSVEYDTADKQFTSNDAASISDVEQLHFFKIVLGDFCQFSPRFPYPRNQCAAMAATALAYNGIKPISQWNANDLNEILLAGQTCYQECLLNLRLTNPRSRDIDLEAINLNKNLSLASQHFEVFADLEECRGGEYVSKETIIKAFEQFELKCFASGIFTYKGFSYAILRYYNSYSKSYFYVFFDSHGRIGNGEKVRPVTGNEGKSAILFFESAKEFIDFFVKEWPITSTSGMYAESHNFVLVPLHFVNITNEINSFESHRLSDVPQIGCAENERETVGSFQIVCGDFNEYNLKLAPYSQHQCLGIVVFSFLYSTLQWIMDWNAENFKDVLSFGNMFYQKRYAQQVANNSQYDSTLIMHPLQLAGHCSYAGFLYKIHVSELEFSGRMTKEHILNGFNHLRNLEIPYGILIVNNLSYGLTLCRFQSSFSYVFFDSHGRTNSGASGGAYSAALYFDNLDVIATFIFNQFRDESGFSIHPVQFSRQEIPSPLKDTSSNIVLSDLNESNTDATGHTLCVALSMRAIFNAYRNGSDNWLGSDLDDIFVGIAN